MSKRDSPPDDEHRPAKRVRQDRKAQVQEIDFARQLQDLLVFRQDGIQQLRDGIASFKAFLESILYHREESNRARQLSILREYLESQKPSESQENERPFLHQLWQAWSFADQDNNEILGASIGSLLAQLLKTLSTLLDFREYGSRLCKGVLQHQNLRLIRRCIGAPVHKDFVISSSTRLLTEVTTFDGGIFAREVYRRRDQTFEFGVLRRNLGLVKVDVTDEELQRKPSIRTLALRYILAHFKYLHEGGKADILKNRPLCTALFLHVRNDPPDLTQQLLFIVEQHVLKDDDVPRMLKSNLLIPQNLERVTEVATRAEDEAQISDQAFAWLKSICTTPSYGVLRHGGWYSPRTETLEHQRAGEILDLGLDSIDFYDHQNSPQIRNTILLSWLKILRPQTNLRERELLVTCFREAPELVMAYFNEKALPMEPKLSNTWIGYASLLFEVICLPIPQFLGNEHDWAEVPPQTSNLIENVLPSPLSQKSLTRCLNQSSELITFFATRILIVSLQKLGQLLSILRSREENDSRKLWQQAADRLLQSFVERAPAMKDVINVFRQTPDDDQRAMQREALCRLLRLFYETAPVQAFDEQFDISASLTSALIRAEQPGQGEVDELGALRRLELEHMLAIARQSPGMRWFHKQGALLYSPVVALLRLHIRDCQNMQIRQLLQSILVDHQILAPAGSDVVPPIDALIISLVGLSPEDSSWGFIDDCIARASRQPIKYVDTIEALQTAAYAEKATCSQALLSPLIAVVAEQAPFVSAKPALELQQQSEYITHLIEAFKVTTGLVLVISGIRERIEQLPGWRRSSRRPDIVTEWQAVKLLPFVEAPDEAMTKATSSQDAHEQPFRKLPVESDSHPELYRWAQKDMDMAFDDGDIAALVLCLCSQYHDIRLQARAQLSKLALQMRSDTSRENAKQIAMLIGELCETFEQQCLPRGVALPYVVGAFAVRSLEVQQQPAHWMYPKLNQYFIRSPEWRIRRLPSYWLSKTVLSMPGDDDAYWREVQWVMDWLVDGLRTTEDLAILQRCSVFEKAMALASSPGMVRHKLLRRSIFELIYRALCIEGGRSMLITRVGVLAWLDMVSDDQNSAILKSLCRNVSDIGDAEKLRSWAGSGGAEFLF